MIPLDSRQLRYFLEIAEQGSVTRAAQVLGVAQPALSLHLKTMEERLGTPLMLRQRTGVVPTEAGLLLAERARRILDDMARTVDDIRSLDAMPSGVVRIGLPGTISDIVSLPLIKAARDLFPGVTITIAEAMSGFIADWMLEDRIDLSILYHGLWSKGFRSEALLEEELVILWSRSTAAPEMVPLHRLDGVPLVLPSRGHGLRELVEKRMREEATALSIAIEIDSYANIKRLVAEGFGPSILPAHAVRAEREAGDLKISRIDGSGLMRRVYLIMPTARPVTRAQMLVEDLLKQVVAQLIRSEAWAGARALI